MSLELVQAGVELNGLYNNGAGARRPPATHEVLSEHPGLLGGESIQAIKSALDTKTISEQKWGRTSLRTMNAADRWHHVAGTAIATDAVGIARLGVSELDPEWIVDRIQKGETDDVIAVASLVKSAREVVTRVQEAHRGYINYLD